MVFENASLNDLEAFSFGHAQDDEAATGCSVVIAAKGAVCGVDVRGGGPATRETDLLRPENMIEKAHAVVLSGGSAFGLAASCGVMDILAARGIGFPIAGTCVPIVSGACLFDLAVGQNLHPDKAMGAQAAQAAFSHSPFEEGNVGAGTGASVGKMLGFERAMKTGIGIKALRFGPLVVAAIVALNASGNVKDPDGGWLAGCRGEDGGIVDSMAAFALAAQAAGDMPPRTNTTLGIVVSNARITKAQATKVSSMAHDAYARAIHPVHTSMDGDAVFTLASGEVETSSDLLAVLATEALEQAIYRAALKSAGGWGLPSAQSLQESRG